MNSFETYKRMRALLSDEEKILVDCYVSYLVDTDKYVDNDIYELAILFMRTRFTFKFDCTL